MAAVVAARRPRPAARTALATAATLAPFLYPSLVLPTPTRVAASFVTLARAAASATSPASRPPTVHRRDPCRRHFASTTTTTTDLPGDTAPSPITRNDLPESRLNPAPDDYAAPTFADHAELTLYAGRGGNGCVSFLREAYLPDGPPNGGDGGTGGNVYIQAAHGETSLHKIARRRFIRAGRGRHGQGSAKSGTRGEDVVITVPVGTVVRELERTDPVADEALTVKLYRAELKARRRREIEIEDEERRQRKLERLRQEKLAEEEEEEEEEEVEDDPLAETDEWEEDLSSRAHARMARHDQLMEEEAAEEDEIEDPQRHKWLLYPGMSKTDAKSASFPRMPQRTRLLSQPPAPIQLDLSRPTPRPILLAAGGVGGLGNAHFCSREHPRPVFATRGDDAVTLRVALELKLLADVGLVGLPNAGKSTLLRALTNSRARVGSWAFTTLQPNIGTVLLDKYSGRPVVPGTAAAAEDGDEDDVRARTRFTVADIPGLIEGAHLDRGLGIAFLRHVERAGVLAFVVDLAAGDAVVALQALWREVALYAAMRDEEERARAAITWDDHDSAPDPFAGGPVNLATLPDAASNTDPTSMTTATAGKPWFVVATKADKPETRANFVALKAYLEAVTEGAQPHPSGLDGAWTKRCAAIPVSAINGQGVDRVVRWMVGLLGE